MPGEGTLDAVLVIGLLCEIFRAKGKKLHCIFVELEKAFDRVSQPIIIDVLRHQDVPEK